VFIHRAPLVVEQGEGSNMRTPIFLATRDGCDVMAFNTVELALTWPERADVAKGSYEGWDADGAPLEVVLRDGRIVLQPASNDAPRKDEFEAALRRLLAAFGEPAPHAGCSIPELVALCDPWVVISTDAGGCSPVGWLLGWLKRPRSTK